MNRYQFTDEQRRWLVEEYIKRSGTRGFMQPLIQDFMIKFPISKPPSPRAIRYNHTKWVRKYTVKNCNSKSSPGDSHSGRRKTVNTPRNRQRLITIYPTVDYIPVLKNQF